jgi:hypothetical protein
MREEQKPLLSILEWAAVGDAIRAKATRAEMEELTSVASRIRDQTLIQSVLMLQEKPLDDHVLLSPAEIHDETGASLWSIREAIRTGRLKARPPSPGARRNLKVPRGEMRAWVALTSGDSSARRDRY